jgi:hypothetical protein
MIAASRIVAARLAARHANAKSRFLSTSPARHITHIPKQVAEEIATCNTSPAKLCGFVGACCNWFLGISAIYDASCKGPEVISLNMTCVMLCYSTLFGRWAGWAVSPRNYILAGSHMFNVACQANQLRRALEYKMETGGEAAKKEVQDLAVKFGIGAAVVTTAVLSADKLKAIVAPIGPAYLSSAGGPFTIHPWPPMTKLMISGTSLLELDRPTDKISLSQYSALTVTGAIFSRYGLVVTPINYPLTSVNVLLFLSSAWHLGRKIKADFL